MPYEVTIHTVRPATASRAIAALQGPLTSGPGKLLACWYSEIGALNQVLVIREYESDRDLAAQREALGASDNPFGINEFVESTATDTFHAFPFIAPMQAGSRQGPYFEVRTYRLKPSGVPRTMELWKKHLPERVKLSTPLAAMYSVTGIVPRFMHVWPYTSLDERHRIRSKSVEMGVWPPPGGPDHIVTMQSDIYLAAAFSPIR
jgi:hypothetical protein